VLKRLNIFEYFDSIAKSRLFAVGRNA